MKFLWAVIFAVFCEYSYSQENFDYTNERTYIASIKKIRNEVGRILQNVPGLLVMHAGAGQSLLYVTLANSTADTIRLVLLRQNLYVVGYVAGGIFYRFNDREFENITVANAVLNDLRMSSHYSSLERVGATNRESINIGYRAFEGAIRNISRYGNGSVPLRLVARELLMLITAISESARFSAISTAVVANYNDPTWELGPRLARLTQNWGAFSQYAMTMSAQANSNARFYSDGANGVRRDHLYGILALALTCIARSPRSLNGVGNAAGGGCGENKADLVLFGGNYMDVKYRAALFYMFR
ncbi:ribosome-inactivating family protein [Paraburkholderia sp. RL17-337-BIB-A]|uniref:ribosome-inactivating family protein n=1 Tax=Paraburkholderia sp. RL17-337-BIB-A TaxID=3031636 RepID=UPI0038B958D3